MTFVAFLISSILVGQSLAQHVAVEYGADISFPMHYEQVSTNYAWLPHNVDPLNNPVPPEFSNMPIQPLGDKASFYKNEFMKGCIEANAPSKKQERCSINEKDRIEMNYRQPQSMLNYTKVGFAKIRAPDRVFQLVKEFWDNNREFAQTEDWPAGNTYTNNWAAPSSMVDIEDISFKGGGYVLKQNIWNAARDTISEWTGQKLAECSLYGIRIYPTGAVLAPHVDRLPLVSSAILNVDQDLDEPWPLEVIGHDGKAHNITMVPGDLVLYESHSIIHGRPFPLKGRFMANVFIHFEPLGPSDSDKDYGTSDLPPYIIPGSPEEENWRSQNPDGYIVMESASFVNGTTEAHYAASEGDLDLLTSEIDLYEEHVNARDSNGWTPLHEAVRWGNIDIVQFLIDRGSDVNARVGKSETGGSVLYIAQEHQEVEENHEALIELLESYGAKYIAPLESEDLEYDDDGSEEVNAEL